MGTFNNTFGNSFQQGALLNQIDVDAKAFISAAGIIDSAQKTIINDLVKDYKSNGLWDKRKAIYPFRSGTTASQHQLNLKNPSNSDAAFRITWGGGITHDANGVKGNGTTGYGNTHLTIKDNLAYNNLSFGIYSADTSEVASGIDIGTIKTDLTVISVKNTGYSGGLFLNGQSYGIDLETGYGGSDGIFSVSTLSNVLTYALRNGHAFLTKTATITDPANDLPFFICAANGAASFSDRQIGFAIIGDGLTPYEAFLENCIIRKYINACNANQSCNNNLLFHVIQPATIVQNTLSFKINTGKHVFIDWGQGAVTDLLGDGSIMSATSNYTTDSKTFYGRIYGDLTDIIKFEVGVAPTMYGLNINDFKRLNIPLYSLILSGGNSFGLDLAKLPMGLVQFYQNNSMSNTAIGNFTALPKYLKGLNIGSSNLFISNGLTGLPVELEYIEFSDWTKDVMNIDNLPSSIKIAVFNYCNNLSGSIKNLPESMAAINIIGSGTGVNITASPMKGWIGTIIKINSGYTTASVDGFFNTWAQTAQGSATHVSIDLKGIGAGLENQAVSAASLSARTSLIALNKDITVN